MSTESGSERLDLDAIRERASVAAGHPTWSVAYAEDVPRLVAEVERGRDLAAACRSLYANMGRARNDLMRRRAEERWMAKMDELL